MRSTMARVRAARRAGLAGPAALLAASCGFTLPAFGDEAVKPDRTEAVSVKGKRPDAYAIGMKTRVTHVDAGPLGENTSTLNVPYSTTTVPQDVIVNQQARNLTDLLQYLPSVQTEARGGVNFGRPQSRGFESDLIANSRVDGLNVVETTPYPAEQLDSLTVLNGLAGALYGPQNPAGIFDYEFERPADELHRFLVGYDSLGAVTEAIDWSGKAGHGGWFTYRINAAHDSGTSYVDGSNLRRNLLDGDFNARIDADNSIQIHASTFTYQDRGIPAGFSYSSSIVPPATPDISKLGFGENYAGNNDETNIGLAKIRHRFNDDWSLTLGGLYQVADRDQYTLSNTLTSATTYSQSITAATGRFIVGSNLGYLNGHVQTGWLGQDLVFGTNGYRESTYGPTSTTQVMLGKATLADPISFSGYQPAVAPLYFSNQAEQQALIVGDTLHLGPQWAVMGVASWSFLSSTSYSAKTRAESANYHRDGGFSPTASLIYKPVSNQTAYFTFANSLQIGDVAPSTGVANPNQALPPYRSTQYELGYKIDLWSRLQLQAAIFRITRPFGFTNPTTDIYSDYGTQRNNGLELYASGHLTRDLAVLGGVTWLDPELVDTGVASTSGKNVVGVPRVQFNMLLDYTVPVPQDSLWHGLALNASVHAADRRAANVNNSSYVDGYVTLNLGARYAFHVHRTPLVARFELDNVANERYWVSVYPTSTSGVTTATYSVTAGTPRTAQATLEVDF